MAGYREFQTGEVLTAANVNDFLMEQSVMKFADAAARDTALGTAVGGANALREGMVAYLDSTDEIQVYDGTSWGGVGLPLGTATPTDGQILAFGTATSTWNPTDQLAGIGSNVVQTVKTDHYISTSASFVAVTGLSVSITPTSATSKILVIAQITFSLGNGNGFGHFKITRGGTDIYVGDTVSTHVPAVFGGYSAVDNDETSIGGCIVYLDSPNTTSSTTYQLEARTASTGSVAINRSIQMFSNLTTNGASTITAIEVAA